jgi:hypothetical protein
MSTDKVLLTVFVTVLIGFLTAAMSIVRLVNDKESKTTDYRQTWTDSLRKCFASLISNINILASITTSRMSSADNIKDLIDHEFENEDIKIQALAEKTRAYFDQRLLDEDEHIREVRRSMHESYALTRLHFKPNDLSFARVEQKFDVILELFEKLRDLPDKKAEGERKVQREKIRAASDEITAFSRDILKTEWEAVKKGERAYQRTKFWSLAGGAVALVGLSIFGIAALWSNLKSESHDVSSHTTSTPSQTATTLPPSSEIRMPDPHASPSSSTSQVVNLYGAGPVCPPVSRPPLPPKTPASAVCASRSNSP